MEPGILHLNVSAPGGSYSTELEVGAGEARTVPITLSEKPAYPPTIGPQKWPAPGVLVPPAAASSEATRSTHWVVPTLLVAGAASAVAGITLFAVSESRYQDFKDRCETSPCDPGESEQRASSGSICSRISGSSAG